MKSNLFYSVLRSIQGNDHLVDGHLVGGHFCVDMEEVAVKVFLNSCSWFNLL